MPTARPKIYARHSPPTSAWLAVNLSVVLPGLGQIYGGAVTKGVLIAIAFLFLALFSAWSVFSGSGNTLTGLLVLLPLMGLYLGSLIDAYRTVSTEPPRIGLGPASPRDAWYAVLLSQILPGLGHLYCQQAVLGGLLLLAGVGIAFLANFQPHLLPLPPLIWAVACAHIYVNLTPRRAWQIGLLTVVLAGLLVGRLLISSVPVLVRHNLEQCIVPSGSMLPTLQINDRLFVREAADYQPQTGDIVVFRAPRAAVEKLKTDPGTLLVKRVIGLPGQQVEVREGLVWIDDQPLVEPYVKAPANYQWGPELVPPGNLFVLGDNRNASGDSHVWGFLPERNLLGRVYKIYWPPDRIQPLPNLIN